MRAATQIATVFWDNGSIKLSLFPFFLSLRVARVDEVFIFAALRSPRREDRNGRLGDRFDDGIDNSAYRGVEAAGEFLSLRPRPRGFGGRGWPGCVEPEEGYAPVVSLDVSTIIFLFRSTTRTQRAGRGLPNGRLVFAVWGKL